MEHKIRAYLDEKRFREAFDLLLAAYQSKVFRLAYALMGDAALAEDMAQEAFVRVWKALPGYRGQSSLSTWIYAITRNTCLTGLRKEMARKEVSLEEPGIEHAVETLRAPGERSRSDMIDLGPLIARLPAKHQRVLRLYYMEQKSYEEVARLLDLPMGTVKVYLHRARKELAAAITQSKMEEAAK